MSITKIGQQKIDGTEFYWASLADYPVNSIFNIGDIQLGREKTVEWCKTTYGDTTQWFTNRENRIFYFKNESYRTMFILRWS